MRMLSLLATVYVVR